MSFTFGERSNRNLADIHPGLAVVVRNAIEISEVDFAVIEGRRSPDRQAQLVAVGASQTHQSKHLIGHAVDVAAWVSGAPCWDWDLYPKIARAIQLASRETGVQVVWGAVWDRQLAFLSDDLPAEVAAYKARRRGKAFLDGGHFELRLDSGLERPKEMPTA